MLVTTDCSTDQHLPCSQGSIEGWALRIHIVAKQPCGLFVNPCFLCMAQKFVITRQFCCTVVTALRGALHGNFMVSRTLGACMAAMSVYAIKPVLDLSAGSCIKLSLTNWDHHGHLTWARQASFKRTTILLSNKSQIALSVIDNSLWCLILPSSPLQVDNRQPAIARGYLDYI